MLSLVRKVFDILNTAFPTPGYLSFDPAGIDIAPKAIRLMKLKKTKHGTIPYKYQEISFDRAIDLSADVIPEEDFKVVVEALKKMKKEQKLEYVVASLPEQKTYIFRTVLPKEARTNIASFIRYQIEENVPLPAVDVNFDYFVTGEVVKDGGIGVVVSVFPKKVIENYTNVFEQAGITPISFMTESSALAKSVVKEGDTTPYLLVRLMPTRVTASILENGVVQYTTDVSVSSDDVIKSYQGESAIHLKEELNKILIYWFTSKKDLTEHRKIENVLLAGHNAASPEMVDFLERHLKINVDVADVWQNCFDIKKYVPQINKDAALDYSVAIGLALKSINYA